MPPTSHPGFLPLPLLASLLLILSSCSVREIGTSLSHTVQGDYYLDSGKSRQGIEHVQAEVATNPESDTANYYYGRFLLGARKYTQASTYLRRACLLRPDNADYQFWAGIAWAGANNPKQEEASYRRALELEPSHLQSLVYLGHNLLEQKRYKEALNTYSKALAIAPDVPAALYNQALILHKLGRSPEEAVAWHQYLSRHPAGTMARKATEHLNLLGDFSYRNHQLGARTITLEKIWFSPLSHTLADSAHGSLDLVGGVVGNMTKGKLQVVVYQKNNTELARTRAQAIKAYLLKEFPKLSPGRIGVSWFATPETIKIGKKKLVIDESVSFFLSQK